MIAMCFFMGVSEENKTRDMNLNPSQGLSKHPTPNVSFVSPLKPIQLI